jgi:predicted dienelactone hydrolase
MPGVLNNMNCQVRKLILILAGIISISNLSSQDTGVEKISLVLRDNARNNRKVPVDIFFPSGSGEKYSGSSSDPQSKLPVICFGHGYLISGIWYRHMVEMIVPQGFILMFPGSEAGLFPSHKILAKDMDFALDQISRLGKEEIADLYGLIDTVKCLMGHSMGGGSLFLAANLDKKIKAAVALSPFDTRPSAIKAASSVEIPVLIFSGSNDCITPSGKHHLPIYNALAGEIKTYILIKGGTHCQMGVSHPKCGAGEKIAGCREGISQEEQLRILAKYLIPWLKYHLKGDVDAGLQFNSFIGQDSTIEYIRSKPLPVECN